MAEDINIFLNSFEKVTRSGKDQNQYKCLCPAHNDKKASLMIKDDTEKSGRILLSCRAGCRTEDILAAVGKDWAAIQPESEKKISPKWHTKFVDGVHYKLVTEYPYRDKDGHYRYSKLRYENEGHTDKTFVIGRIINGELKYGRGDADPTLYNLPELGKAIEAGKTIYYVEGEKDVETLRKHGLTAVSAGSVKDWRPELAACFIGAHEVVIIADRDEPGQELAREVSRALRGVVYKHKLITPSGRNKGDVTDYLTEEGGTREGLLEIVKDAADIFAYWVSEKGKINPDLLGAEYMKRNHLFIARNPGTKSDIIFLYKDGVYHKLSETELGSEVRRWIPIGMARPDTINQVVKMILFSAPIRTYDKLDADECYINLRNGLIDIHSGELRPHDPELISTRQLSCEYVPKATSPTWEKFIESLCYDPDTDEVDIEMVNALQEWTGFILSPIYGYRTKRCLLLFSALGNSGKSVFLTILRKMLGDESTANVDFEALGSSRWATGRAFGKRLLAIGDEGGQNISSSQNFKQMTGGDPVDAEFKGLQGFQYLFRGVICAACNLLPFFTDDKGDHIAERLYMLNCRHTIPMADRDPMYADKLLDEKNGIFMWAMEGLQRFLENGMKFSPCGSSEELLEEYRARHDTMYAFLKDSIVITGSRSDSIRKTELEGMYEVYCENNDVTPLKRRNIKPRLASMGITTRNHNNIEVYTGIKPKYDT